MMQCPRVPAHRHESKRMLGAVALVLLTSLAAPALAQDIRGLEVCTAEKQMDRRTSCLQSNVEFLQQALDRHQRDAQRKLAAADAEIAALKARLAKIESDMVLLKAKPADIKPGDVKK